VPPGGPIAHNAASTATHASSLSRGEVLTRSADIIANRELPPANANTDPTRTTEGQNNRSYLHHQP
jgi:hypothetical protein